MTDFAASWNLSRGRLLDEISSLNTEQLRWRMYEGALSIGEMGIHVAGVEMMFASQILGSELRADEKRIVASARDGVVNDQPFPFTEDEITPESVADSLASARALLSPLMEDPSEEELAKELISALGPVITGKGALTRLAFHPAYHQGQAYQMKGCPNFPA